MPMEHRSTEPAGDRQGELRWLADAYEQTQRVRIQTGERIRALLQARSVVGNPHRNEQIARRSGSPEPLAAAEELKRIRRGECQGPVPLLGWTYRRHWEAEQTLCQGMEDCLEQHPAWPWLRQVKGIGPTLACKLLARLDPEKADTPSAFWAYCGLATVPGIEYRCATCGYTAAFPERYRVSGVHSRLGSRRECSGVLDRARGSEEGVRVAQPKPAKGEKSPYDQYAKKVCYLIATSMLKARGAYAKHYRHERSRLDRDRPGWSPARRHLSALRKLEKLFLCHLWIVWRTALDLPVTAPYGVRQSGGSALSDPWAMAEKPEVSHGSGVAQQAGGGTYPVVQKTLTCHGPVD